MNYLEKRYQKDPNIVSRKIAHTRIVIFENFVKKVAKLRKLWYYRDIALLLRVFVNSFRISLSRSDSLISLANPKQNHYNHSKEKMIKYVNFCSFLRRKIGLRNTCLTYSILLCRMLRSSGINARVNFASKKEENRMLGHCWVIVEGEKISSDFQPIFKYP